MSLRFRVLAPDPDGPDPSSHRSADTPAPDEPIASDPSRHDTLNRDTLNRDTPERETLDWVHRVRSGDPVVFDEMYAALGVQLCAYAYRWTQSRAIAEELVQEVFLNIWTHRLEWDIRGSMTPYLFRAVRNHVLNHLRHLRVERRHAALADTEWTNPASAAMLGTPTDESFVREERRVAIQHAITELPERSREVFLLNREQGLKYTEIAAMLGVSVKTVEYHMGRAFAQLRRTLAAWSPELPDTDRGA